MAPPAGAPSLARMAARRAVAGPLSRLSPLTKATTRRTGCAQEKRTAELVRPAAPLALPATVSLSGRCVFTAFGKAPVSPFPTQHLDAAAADAATSSSPDVSAGVSDCGAPGDVEIRLVWYVGSDGMVTEQDELATPLRTDVDPRRWGRSTVAQHNRTFTASRSRRFDAASRHEGSRFDVEGLRGTFGQVAERSHTLDGFDLFNQQGLVTSLQNLPHGGFETFLYVKLPPRILEAAPLSTPPVVPVPLDGFAKLLGSANFDFDSSAKQRMLSGMLAAAVRQLHILQTTQGGASAAGGAAARLSRPRLDAPRYTLNERLLVAQDQRGLQDAAWSLPKTNRTPTNTD